MNWNWRAMGAIMRKDLRQVAQNKMVWLPMIVVPVMFTVILPLVLILLPSMLSPTEFEAESNELTSLFRAMPEEFKRPLQDMSPIQSWVMLSANYLFAPMFLIVPLMVSSILGADSFAGEKERKTLEGLLYTPLSDAELIVAKLLVAFIPALVIDIASFLVYGLVVNLAGYRVMGRIFFPVATWWPLVFWVAPAISLAGLGATVLISAKAKGFMEAQQLSGALVLPIVFMMIGQVSGLFFLGVGLLVIVGLFAGVIGAWMVWIGAKTFARGEIIARI